MNAIPLPPRSKRYIAQAVLRAIAVEVQRIADDRHRLGRPMPSDAQMGDWLSYSPSAVRIVRDHLRLS